MTPVIVRDIIIIAFMAYYLFTPLFIGNSSTDMLSVNWIYLPVILSIALYLYYYMVDLNLLKIKTSFTSISPRQIPFYVLAVLFFVSLMQFYYYPWHYTEARDNDLGSISALMRIMWLALAPLSLNCSTKKTNASYLCFSVLLSIVDGSRTVFFICILISVSKLFFSRIKTLLILSALLLLLLIIAAVRSAWNIEGLGNGLIGEQTLATLTFFKTLNEKFTDVEKLHQFLYLFLIPFIFPLLKIQSFLNFDLGFSDVMNKFSHLQEMGGGFIGTHFIPFGSLTVIFIPIYLIITIYMTNLLLSWYSPVLSCFIPVLSIKSSPLVYWNFVYMLSLSLVLFSLLIRSSILNRILKPTLGNHNEPFSLN